MFKNRRRDIFSSFLNAIDFYLVTMEPQSIVIRWASVGCMLPIITVVHRMGEADFSKIDVSL
jgi:hypothetical protein